MRNDSRITSRSRSGSITVELLLVVPVLLIVLVGAIEFTTIQIVQSAVTHAAGVGARQGGKDGTIDDVVSAVNGVLSAVNVEITDVADSGGKVVLEKGPGTQFAFGDPNLDCDPPANPVLEVDDVRVTVCIKVNATPVIDADDCYGITLTGKRFYVSSLVKRERPQVP